MDTESIEKKIYILLAENLKKRGLRLNLKNTDSIIARGVLDSLSALELVAGIEKIFNIRVLPEEMTEANFESIERIKNFIKKKLKM